MHIAENTDISEETGEEDMFSQSMPEDSFLSRYRNAGHEPMSPATPDRVAPTDRGKRLRFVSESDDSSASTLTEVGMCDLFLRV